MSGWDYETLRDGVIHAVGNLQREFLKSHGIEDITQVDTDLGEDLERAIFRIADCIQSQLVLERNPISVHYCEKDDMTFIMRDKYDDNGTLIEKACVGWYFGKPNKVNTDAYVGKLVADYMGEEQKNNG